MFTDAPARAAEAAAAGDYRAALDHATGSNWPPGSSARRCCATRSRPAPTGGRWPSCSEPTPSRPLQPAPSWTATAPRPAQQRPGHAVVLTAGRAAVHDMRAEYGIDIEDLGTGHSLHAEPGVRRVRDTTSLLGDDVWICVTVPGGFEGAEGDPAPGEDIIRQWTSVVTDAGELRWLKEMLALNAAGDEAGG